MEFARLHLGLVLVIVGVVGEGVEIIWKLLVRKRSEKLDLFLNSIGAFFWIVLVIGLALEIRDAAITDKEAAESNRLAGQANERAANAEKQVEQLRSTNLVLQSRLEKIQNMQAPRVALAWKIDKSLEGKPAGTAEIFYQEGDGEVYEFAGWLKSLLVHAKWNVTEPRPIGDTISGSYSGISRDEVQKWSSTMRLGAHGDGVTIIANGKTMITLRDKEINPLKGILSALVALDIRVSLGQDDISLPDGLIRIVVAPR